MVMVDKEFQAKVIQREGLIESVRPRKTRLR